MLPAQEPGCVREYQITTNHVQIYTCRESPRYGAGSETPMHPSRTPMHHPSYMTPMRDSSFGTGSHCLPFVFRDKTNLSSGFVLLNFKNLGSVSVAATPYHDGMRTPMRDRAWNPHTPMTPHRFVDLFLDCNSIFFC